MKVFLLAPYYLSWHYSRAIGHILDAFRNLLYFTINFYSLKLLSRTLAHPFRRNIRFAAKKSEDQKEMFLVTIVMRLIGLIVRLFTIVVGLCAVLITFLFWAIVILCWLLLPFVMLVGGLAALIALI